MAYEFGKFYTLGKSRGIPVYANGVLIYTTASNRLVVAR
jgi:hypothetical protein